MQPVKVAFALRLTIFVLTAIEFLQSGMIAFAAGPIMGGLGMSPEDFSAVSAAYASVAILMISMQRWLVERLGWRGFILASAVIFIAGCIGCAQADAFIGFLCGRLAMGVGGAAMFTSARLLVNVIPPGPARFVGIKALATSLALATAAAPWLASVLIAEEQWHAIFAVVAGLGLVAFLLAYFHFPRLQMPVLPPTSRASLPRQLLLLCGSFGVLYALQRLYYDFYGDVGTVVVVLFAALAALGVFFVGEARQTSPLLQVRATFSLRFASGLGLFLFAYVMLGANNYVVPIMLQKTLGLSWETVGHVEAIGLSGAIVTWVIMSQVIPRSPAPRKFLMIGFLALGTFAFLLGRLTTATDLWVHVIPAIVCNSVFILTVLPIAAMQTFRDLEQDQAVFGNAQQLKNMMSQAGIALGVSLATIGQQWRITAHYAVLNEQITPTNPVFVNTLERIRTALGPAFGPEQSMQLAVAQIAQLLSQQSAMLANIDHFRVVVMLAAIACVLTLTQRVFR